MAPRAVLRPNGDKSRPPPPVRFHDVDSRNAQPGTATGNLSRPILSSMALNTSRGTTTSALDPSMIVAGSVHSGNVGVSNEQCVHLHIAIQPFDPESYGLDIVT